MKKCSKCNKLKHETGFYREERVCSKLMAQCRICMNKARVIYNKNRKYKNPDGKEYADKMLKYLEFNQDLERDL